MQDLIDRAEMNEDTDIEALRELAVSVSVDGTEPTARTVVTDGGVSR